ncbi:Ycf48-like protein precursor [compost metagenome]
MVLHSADGGLSWTLQLDGQQASRLILDYYSDPAQGGAVPDAQSLVEREQVLIGYGGTQPLMAVHFTDAQNGFVVGLFNRILHTADGGKTWEPWQHRIDNLNELHFYSLTADGEAIYITGEQGMVWRMAKDAEQFSAIPTDYAGTLFGATSNGKVLIAFGMRGSVFRSEDAGITWQKVDLDISAGITAGTFLDNGQLVLGSLSGDLALSRDEGQSFNAVTLKKSMPFFGLVAEPAGQLTLVGASGVLREAVVLQPAAGGNAGRLVESNTDRQTNLLGAGYGRSH